MQISKENVNSIESLGENRPDYRNHRTGWLVSDGVAAGKRLHGAWRGATYERPVALAHRAFEARCKNLRSTIISPLRRPRRQHERRIVADVCPTELYHLAGQSHVGLSFEIPESTCEEAGIATLRLLEIARAQPQPPRFYHASTSEIFGNAFEVPQTENTPLRPTSPYGCAKAFATQLARVYREAYGLFVCNGILYNHESPRRA